MLRYSSISKTTLTAIWGVMLSLPLTIMAACSSDALKPFNQYSEYAIKAANTEDKADVKWASYLKSHFQKRATDRDCIIAGKSQDDSQLQITVDMDPQLEGDYAVTIAPHEIILKAHDINAMLWLQYQFMSTAASEDNRFTGSDLPPATIDCKHNTTGKFAFEYRSLYTPSNTDADLMPILGIGNVDFDWGLWGHNLHKVFTDNIPTEALALIDGKRNSNQFCFSSEALYNAYEQFVTDNYGDGSDGITTRFAVMPNDNSLVCQCASCKAKGNTAQSATAAVTVFIQRLARRFPHQMFYTSAYSTTRKAPAEKLPGNVGVIISAIDMPLSPDAATAKGRNDLETQIKTWKKYCGHIYIWDYMRNFDDYLTPYPCLHHMQNRIKYYRSVGVNGIFLNGSGYDYASFDDVQTYVLAQMLINPDINVDDCAAKYFAKTYPKTGKLLTNYYTALEKRAAESTLPFYGGISMALAAYIEPQALINFIAQADRLSKQTEGEERSRLNQLLTALAFTRLEIFRTQGQAPDHGQIDAQTSLLSQHTAFENMANYRESNGSIDDYLRQWNENFPWLKSSDNLLTQGTITATPAMDGISLLTDGKQAFTTDYHEGWLITPEVTLKLAIQTQMPSTAIFKISTLNAPQWHIYAPSAVEIKQNGVVKGRTTITASTTNKRQNVTVKATGLQPNIKTEINIIQATVATVRKTMAIDEISATK